MTSRTIVFSLEMCFAGITMCLADDSMMGTWKLNETKSRFHPGAPKNTIVRCEPLGDNVKFTVEGIDGDGKTTHHYEWNGKFDGKAYPVVGDPGSDMWSYEIVADRNMNFTATKERSVVATAEIVISADGKTRTVTVHATDSKGNKVSSTSVYDKQW